MAKGWQTNRGDEWWYEAGAVHATAGFGGGTVAIEEVRVRGRALQAGDVQQLLSSAFDVFDGARIVLDMGSPEVKSALDVLKGSGLINTTIIEAPYSKQVLVLYVRAPEEAP